MPNPYATTPSRHIINQIKIRKGELGIYTRARARAERRNKEYEQDDCETECIQDLQLLNEELDRRPLEEQINVVDYSTYPIANLEREKEIWKSEKARLERKEKRLARRNECLSQEDLDEQKDILSKIAEIEGYISSKKDEQALQDELPA